MKVHESGTAIARVMYDNKSNESNSSKEFIIAINNEDFQCSPMSAGDGGRGGVVVVGGVAT